MVRALPALRTYTPGDLVTAAFMNAINYAITFGCLQPPQVETYQTVGQSIPTGTFTALLFDSEIVDSDTFHSTSTNTSRIVAPWPGWYEFTGGVAYATNATGRRGCEWAVNGTAITGAQVMEALAASLPSIDARTVRSYLNAGDYVELWAYQDSGGALLTSVATTNDPLALVSFVSQ